MKMTNMLLSFITCALAFSLLSSCESSKIAYGNSYYFKQTPKKTPPRQPVEEKALVASIDKSPLETLPAGEPVRASLSRLSALAADRAALTSALRTEKQALTRTEKKLIRQERRENKREMRKELRILAKEYRSAPEEVKEQFSVKEVTGNVRTGIILGAAGLVLMIIGVSPLHAIGAILLVVGLVLILIDVL